MSDAAFLAWRGTASQQRICSGFCLAMTQIASSIRARSTSMLRPLNCLFTVCSTMCYLFVDCLFNYVCYLFAENYGRRHHSLTQTRGKKPANAWCACRTCWQRMRPRTSCPRSGREHIITLMSSGSFFNFLEFILVIHCSLFPGSLQTYSSRFLFSNN